MMDRRTFLSSIAAIAVAAKVDAVCSLPPEALGDRAVQPPPEGSIGDEPPPTQLEWDFTAEDFDTFHRRTAASAARSR